MLSKFSKKKKSKTSNDKSCKNRKFWQMFWQLFLKNEPFKTSLTFFLRKSWFLKNVVDKFHLIEIELNFIFFKTCLYSFFKLSVFWDISLHSFQIFKIFETFIGRFLIYSVFEKEISLHFLKESIKKPVYFSIF